MAAEDLLASIPKLLDARDAAALVELEDHADKKVRKAARKAIHQLRSRGVEIPEKGARSWSTTGLDALRGDLSPRGLVDVHSIPGATRLVLSMPEDEEGGSLMIGIVGPEGRLLDFAAYIQTDGQRQRMIKDWDRINEGRVVPAEWVRSRLRWSRERTLALGHSVPPSFDDVLTRLGDAPDSAPANFLDEVLAETKASDASTDEVLRTAGVGRWPLLFDGNDLFAKLGDRGDQEGSDPAERSDEDKIKEIQDAASDDEKVRDGLRGAAANALDDSAINIWLDGKLEQAKRLLEMAKELRENEAPEKLPWVAEFIRFQVASVALSQLAQANAPHGAPGHVHGPDCDH